MPVGGPASIEILSLRRLPRGKSGMKNDRSSKPRGKPGAAPARGGPRKPARSFAETAARRPTSTRPPRDRAEVADPYKAARRPPRDPAARGEGDARFPRGERGSFAQRGAHGERERGERRGFTVTLDPDVARVFRGDASVNRALRLVMQLMQVVQGPPPQRREPRGYQGTPEARGFTRRARFEDEDKSSGESNE
jgi:hypothetical protein